MYHFKGPKPKNLDLQSNESASKVQNKLAYQTSNASLLSMGLSCTRNFASRTLQHNDQESNIQAASSPDNKKHIKKQVDQQQLIIENRIRRLNQERDRTLKIIEQTIQTTYRFKSVQRERQERQTYVSQHRQVQQQVIETQRLQHHEQKQTQTIIKQLQKDAREKYNKQVKETIKQTIEQQLSNVEKEQLKEQEDRRLKAHHEKANRQFKKYKRIAEDEQRRMNVQRESKEKLIKDIQEGQSRIESLAEIEMELIKELSSTQKMKQDVEETLTRLRKKNYTGSGIKVPSSILDRESQILLDQFNQEYLIMKR